MLPLGCGAGTGGPTTSFDVYFHNDALAADASDCTAVFPVHRVVPQTQAVASEALRSLFGGPNTEERGAGYRSFFSSDTAGLLKRLRIGHGTAYVDLEDPRDLLAGATSSCGAAELQSEIATTLRQFPSVERVIFAIEGDPRAFYAWMGEPCGPANDDCDPQPFR
jgi:spore germination protein GerM